MKIGSRVYPDVIITCLASDGEATVWIKGKFYFYHGLDTAIYPQVRRLEKRKPWKAFHLIKASATSFDKGGDK